MPTPSPLVVASRINPLALRDPCSKEGWYATENIAKRELRHIQQNVRGRFSNHYPVRVYFCEVHDVWHLTSRSEETS